MKRSLYIAFIAATTFSIAACTKQIIAPTPQVPDASRSYIFFEPDVVTSDNTKATILTGETLPTAVGTAFGVIGYHGTISLFGAPTPSNKGIAQVARSVDGVFEYSPLAAWQGADNHDFYAFYPYNLNAYVSHNVNNTTNLANPYITYSQPTANDATMVDLLTAKTSVTKAAGDEVAIKFYHRLWALDVVITNGQTEGIDPDDQVTNAPTLTIKSVSVTVENFPTGAQIYLNKDHSPGLVLNTATNKYTYTINPKATNGDVLANSGETATATYGSLLFLPITAGTFKYSLEITYLDSRGVESTFSTGTAKTINKAFEAGKRYKFTVNKTNDTFVIGTLTPTDWTDQDVNHEFN